jgi:hypothetical protein
MPAKEICNKCRQESGIGFTPLNCIKDISWFCVLEWVNRVSEEESPPRGCRKLFECSLVESVNVDKKKREAAP